MECKAQYTVETTGSVSIVRMVNPGKSELARGESPSNCEDGVPPRDTRRPPDREDEPSS